MDRVRSDVPIQDFRALFESAPGSYLVLKPDAPRYSIAAVSDGYLSSSRLKREEILGRGLFEVFGAAPASLKAGGLRDMRESLERVLVHRTLDVMPIQRCQVRANDDTSDPPSERFWSAVNSPVFGENTELIYIIHRIEDITESHRVSAALTESEDRFRRIFQYAATGIAISDMNGRFLQCNPAFCALTGYTEQELRQRQFALIVHPDDRAQNLELAALLNSEQIPSFQIENRYVAKGGETVWVEKFVSLLRDEHGKPTHQLVLVTDVTLRKRAEQALRESEERVRLASEATGVGSYDFDTKTKRTLWTDALWRLMGLPPAKESSIEILDSAIHPDDRVRFWQNADSVISGQNRGPYEIEFRIVRPDGQVRCMLNRGESMFGDGEQNPPSRLVGTVLDITDRKRAEDAVRESEAKFRGIISISADAIMFVDEQGRISVFNAGAEKIFGYTQAEAVGAPLDLLIPERFRAIHRQHLISFAARDESARRMGSRGQTLTGRRKSGEEFPVDATIAKLEVGGKRFLSVALRDITEQKRSEHEQKFLAELGAVLASSLEHEDTLTSIAQMAVRELADFCLVEILEASMAISRLVIHRDSEKAPLAEALRHLKVDGHGPRLGASVLETKQPVLMREVTREHLQSLAQNDNYLQALRALDPKSYIALPLLAHGRLLGALVLVSTNPMRRYEPRELPLAEELARRAALAVHSARLYQAAQRAAAARDDVLGVVAHDLRNPLQTILLKSQLLSRASRESPADQDLANSIGRSARRMARLIEDLLDVVRMDAGQLSVLRAELSAEQLVLDAVDAQKPLAASAELELCLELHPLLPPLYADRDRLLQVFENLIGNAIKFTKPGGHIKVGAAPQGRELLFWVADTGCGIPAEHLRHLFDRFWQARRNDRAGMGLGLSIVKGIVEAHEGRLWVESTLGHGSTFYFTAPAAAYSADPMPPESPPPSCII